MRNVLLVLTVLAGLPTLPASAQTPYLASPNGRYLGNLSANQFDPNSTSNQFGRYGSQFSPDSINNQFGQYGSQFSPNSANNPYATSAPRIFCCR